MPTLSSEAESACYAELRNAMSLRLAAVRCESAAYYAAPMDAIGFCIISGSEPSLSLAA